MGDNRSNFTSRGGRNQRKGPQQGKKGKKQKNKYRDLTSYLNPGTSLWPYTGAWTDSRTEQVRHFKQWVFIAVSTIAEQIASNKPNLSYVTRKDPAAGRTEKRRALLPLQSHEDLKPLEYDHPLSRLLDDPNEPDTSFDLWYETVLFLLLTGSAYWWVPKNKLGLPEAIWVIPSHWVWPIPGNGKVTGYYELRPVEGNYIRKVIPEDEIIHFRYKNPISRIDGYSPLTAIGAWIDTSEAIDSSRWFAYNNGTTPTVAIQFNADIEDPDEEQLRRIEAKYITRMVGPSRSNKPLFLPPGVTVKPLTIVPNQMVFGETAEETRDNILAAFKVPHIVAGISKNMTNGSILAAQTGFMAFSVNPRCKFLGQVVTEKLANPCYSYDNVTVRVWFEDQTPENPQLRENILKTDLLYGARTTNEVRVLRGLEPYDPSIVPWANTPLLPVNVAPGTLPGGGEHDHYEKPGTEEEMPKINDEKDFHNFILSRGGSYQSLRNGKY